MQFLKSLTFKIYFAALLSASILLFTLPALSGEYQQARLISDASVRNQPAATGAELLRMSKGAAVRVYTPDRSGWYAIYFPTPVKGSKFGWINASAIELSGAIKSGDNKSGTSTAQSEPSVKGKKRTRSISVQARLNSASPGELHDAVGIARSSVSGETFSLIYEQRLGNMFFGGAILNWGSLSKSFMMSTAAAHYDASELSAALEFGMLPIHIGRFSAGLGVTLGFGIWTAGTTDDTHSTISTSGISSIPMSGFSAFRFDLSERVTLSSDIGYKILKLTQVPIYATAVDVNYTPVDFNLSGLFFSFGMGFRF